MICDTEDLKDYNQKMIKETLKSLFARDLDSLANEVESYKDESNIWQIDKGITNSAGNLCLHLLGNLNAFVGAEIGKSDYVRDREFEFSAKDVPRSELLQSVGDTKEVVLSAIDSMNAAKFEEDYPIDVFAHKMTFGYFLIHLTTHLSYHLGQINYHRRLLDE